MAASKGIAGGQVIISGGWWAEMQQCLQEAVDTCNAVTSMITAHQHYGKCMAGELLDTIDGDVRAIRKLIEAVIAPI